MSNDSPESTSFLVISVITPLEPTKLFSAMLETGVQFQVGAKHLLHILLGRFGYFKSLGLQNAPTAKECQLKKLSLEFTFHFRVLRQRNLSEE